MWTSRVYTFYPGTSLVIKVTEENPSSPFPQGLRAKDLKVGMVVTLGNCEGQIYTLLKPPEDRYIMTSVTGKGHLRPLQRLICLAFLGCQPYKNGKWNQSNWLREVNVASPFPQGLRTKDLKVGIVVTRGNAKKVGFIYTILESPGIKWVKVILVEVKP